MEGVIAKRSILKKDFLESSSQNEEIGKKNSSVITISLIITAMVISCSLFHVWSNIKLVNTGYEISKANNEGKALLQLNKKLKLEMATLKSPHHIERIARKELRLTSPTPNQLVIIK